MPPLRRVVSHELSQVQPPAKGPDRLQFARGIAERAERWMGRLRPMVADAGDPVDPATRRNIEDFVAAATAEITAVLYSGQAALERAHEDSTASGATARNNARQFRDDWLEPRYLMKGLSAVRHLNVHIASQASGRILFAAVGAAPSRSDIWSHPGISPELNDRLSASAQLTPDELARFNADVGKKDVIEILADGLRLGRDYLDDVEQEISALGLPSP